jgi:ParB-like chromosome segregation protein Spo0J
MQATFPDRRLEQTPIGDLKPHDLNPRTHSKKQLEQIAASIRRFGFTNPVLIDEEQRIIAGHGRVAAAKILGPTEVPTATLSGMSETERRASLMAEMNGR